MAWNGLNHRSGKVASARFASPGFYFTHATEGGQWKSRMPGTWEFKDAPVIDFLDRPWRDAVEFNAKIPLLQSAFLTWNDVHLLSQVPHSLDVVTPEGEHYSLVPTSNNDFVNPNGSAYAGMTYNFLIPNKGGRKIDLDYKTTLFDSQEQWIYSNTATGGGGASGGTPLGLAAEGYNVAEFRASNFVYAQYGPQGALSSTYDIGTLGDGSSIGIQSVGSTNSLGQTSSEFLTHTVTLNCQETAASQILQRAQYGNLDQELLIYTRYNETFDWQGGCLRPERTGVSWDDKNGVRMTKLVFKGTTAYAQVNLNTSPGGISLGIATFTLA